MIKDVATRFLFGFSLGNLIGGVVNIIISAFIGGGAFLAVMPQLAAQFKTELGAVVCQCFMVGLIGVVFAESALVFKIESWSTLKQYSMHFFITAVFYTPFVYICWMPDSFFTVGIMLMNFLFTYTVTYFIQYSVNKSAVNEINKKIRERSSETTESGDFD